MRSLTLALVSLLLVVKSSFSQVKVGDPLRIASFNIQDLGDSKVGKPEVVDILIKILDDYDITGIQEIVDKDQTVLPELMAVLNAQAGDAFSFVISDRVGRTSAQEQYAFIYRKARVRVLDWWMYDDSRHDIFEREPHIAVFEASDSNVPQFTLVNIHVKPDDAVAEVDALADVVDSIRMRVKAAAAQNIMVLGDYNADCNYVTESDWHHISLRTRNEFFWWIQDDVDTTVKDTDCAYDRFVTIGSGFLEYILPSTVGARNFQSEFQLSDDQAAAVSDHYPVELQIQPAAKTTRALDYSIAFTVKNKEVPAQSVMALLQRSEGPKGFKKLQQLFDASGTVVEVALVASKEPPSVSAVLELIEELEKFSPEVGTRDVRYSIEYKMKRNVLDDNSVYRQPTKPRFTFNLRCRPAGTQKWECDFNIAKKTFIA